MKPYYENSNGRLFLGNCLEVMLELKDKSVDMILCDLPYGTTACKWDTVIPFEPLWVQYKRLIKDNGAIVLTASQPFTSALVMSNPGWFKYEWIWEKEQGSMPMNAPYQPIKVHEQALVFSGAAATYSTKSNMNYFPLKTVGSPYRASQRKSGNIVFHSNPSGDHFNDNPGERYPKSVLRMNTERGLHPTQKPVALFSYLIRTYTNEGDTVLDNCAGSGTTGIACIRTNRNYILIEKEQKYVDIINKRIEAEKKQIKMF